MQRRFDKIIEGLLPEGSATLLAVSGGVDSMCMAELFARSPLFAGESAGRSFAVAHCNFHLRGDESDRDAILVEKWAEEHKVGFFRADFDTAGYASSHSCSIEMAARELRYDWFLKICKQKGFFATAVAHNSNDNAETLILNLLRGTGLRGISGMRYSSPMPVKDGGDVSLLRPMLDFSRDEIERYAAAEGLKYCCDSTNSETEYKRNRVRHQVFPIFESINPSFLDTFARDMNSFRQESEIAEDYFNDCRSRLIIGGGEKNGVISESEEVLKIDIATLMTERHWKYLLYRLLEPFGFRDRLLAPIIRLLEEGNTLSGKTFESPGYRLYTEPGRLIVKRASQPYLPVKDLRADTSCAVVRDAGRYRFDDFCFEVGLTARKSNQSVKEEAVELAQKGILALDAASVEMPFIVRRWHKGDWMRPIGNRGKKKLSDIFTDLKLGLSEKHRALVLVVPSDNTISSSGDANENAGEHVAAMCCHASGKFICRVDESYKLRPATGTILTVSIES